MWVLLVVMVGIGGSLSPAMQEFETKDKCEQAAAWFNDASRLKVKTICVPKN